MSSAPGTAPVCDPVFAIDTVLTKYHIPEHDDRFATGDLTPDYPQHPYVGNSEKLYNWTGKKFNVRRCRAHWGQRKLLMSEIDFLSCLNPEENYLVVYAGAADGRHMPVLTTMFSNITMHLYDPRPFYPGIASDRILLNPHIVKGEEGWFTDTIAKLYVGKNVVFISDIRCEPTEADISKNQTDQQNWVRMMRPILSMLKFKLPYPDYTLGEQYYTYMKGSIRFQAWAPITSAETRLIVKQNEIDINVNYPINRYERNCSWYNFRLRTKSYKNTKAGDIFASYVGSDTFIGFDFAYEIEIIKKYLSYMDVSAEYNPNIHSCIYMINKVLINEGAKFDNYLKANSSSYNKLLKK